jgi:hypothetical protein
MALTGEMGYRLPGGSSRVYGDVSRTPRIIEAQTTSAFASGSPDMQSDHEPLTRSSSHESLHQSVSGYNQLTNGGIA